MSDPGQVETFPTLPGMSVVGCRADEISTITDIGQRMSVAGGTSDVSRAWPELLLLANSGNTFELAEPLLPGRLKGRQQVVAIIEGPVLDAGQVPTHLARMA